MAEVAASAPKKAKAAGVKKEKAPASHPKYIEMAVAALNSLKERGGSSRQAILKYITSHYQVGQDSKVVGTHLKLALKRGVDTGVIKHVKGTGASGSFKANPEAKEKKPKAAKKAKASKPKKAKVPKSPAKAKKAAAAKPVKSKASKSPAKASKSPAKKTASKKVASPKKEAKKKVAAKK